MKRKTSEPGDRLAILSAMLPMVALGAGRAGAAPQASSRATEPRPRTLDTITVTARKREETLQDVPVAVTAFTAEALDKLNVDDLGDLDAQVPNLTIYAARGSSSTITAYIRGVGQSDPLWGVDPGVGIYLDDVYIARPQGGLLDVFDVERVEVLRGPQGTLYGKNTIGGAIKYISRGLPTEIRRLRRGHHRQLRPARRQGGRRRRARRQRRAARAASPWPTCTATASARTWSPARTSATRTSSRCAASSAPIVTDDFDVQFAFDRMDDTVRRARRADAGAQSVRPSSSRRPARAGERAAATTATTCATACPTSTTPSMLGVSATANWRASDDWPSSTSGPSASPTPKPTSTSTRCRRRSADVKAFYSDEQVSQRVAGQLRRRRPRARRDGHLLLQRRGRRPGAQQLLQPVLRRHPGHGLHRRAPRVYADWTFDLTEQPQARRRRALHRRGQARGGAQPLLHRRQLHHAGNCAGSTPIARASTSRSTSRTPRRRSRWTTRSTTTSWCTAWPARGFKSGGYNIRAARHRGAALGRAVRGRAGRQLRNRQQDGACSTTRCS